MKKLLFFSVIFCFLAITSCYPPPSASYELYKITVEEEKTIDGVRHESSMLIYQDYARSLSLYSRRMDGKEGYDYYGFQLIYEGSGWIFYESIKIKIDDKDAITLVDKKPSRMVLHGGKVRESLRFLLRGDAILSLRECNSLAIQITKLIEIPPEGIEKIKEFLVEQALEDDSEEQSSEDDSEEQVLEE